MPTSDWGDWLVRAIEDASPDGVAVWYFGCNGFALKETDGTTIYIDPYLGTGDPPRTVRMIPVPFDSADIVDGDAVLATHEHTDHVHGPSQAPILENTDATYYAPGDSLAVVDEEGWTNEWDVADGQFTEIDTGDSFDVGEFAVHVEPANDPDATQPVSYVIEHDAGVFFHGGDARPSEEFERIGRSYDIDLGVLAFGTVGNIPDKETREPKRTRWYNDENQIVEAASQLQLERLIPSHWDMWRGLTADPKSLSHHAKTFDRPADLELVEIGDRVEL